MTEWDTQTEQRWRSWLGAAGAIGSTADHAPEQIGGAWDVLDHQADLLRRHLQDAGSSIADALDDPGLRDQLLTMAVAMWGRVEPGEVDWALQQLGQRSQG